MHQMQQIVQQVQNFAGRKTLRKHAIPHLIRKRVLHIKTTLLKVRFCQTKADHCMVVCLRSGLLVVSVSKPKFAGKWLQMTAKIHLLDVWRMLWELLWELLRHMVDHGTWKE